MIRTGTVRVALSVWLAVVSLWSAASTAQTPDPQSLLGEWHGTYTDPRDTRTTGSCIITVKKIEEAKVFIHVHLAGSRSTEVDREGTLSGNILTVETAANTTVFTIEGDRMSGFLQSVLLGVPVQEIMFTLHKKK